MRATVNLALLLHIPGPNYQPIEPTNLLTSDSHLRHNTIPLDRRECVLSDCWQYKSLSFIVLRKVIAAHWRQHSIHRSAPPLSISSIFDYLLIEAVELRVLKMARLAFRTQSTSRTSMVVWVWLALVWVHGGLLLYRCLGCACHIALSVNFSHGFRVIASCCKADDVSRWL